MNNELIKIEEEPKRNFYIKETITEKELIDAIEEEKKNLELNE